MSEYYEGENTCLRCLRNSPIASLLGLIAVLIGGGAFGGATIFARKHLDEILHAPHLFPCLDYVIYGLIGATALFSTLAYCLCAVSTGRNAKHYFESSFKSACARCCNMTFLLCLLLGIILWAAIVCLMAYPLMSIALLMHRHEGPTRLRLASLEPTGLGRVRRDDTNWNQFDATHRYYPRTQLYEQNLGSHDGQQVDWAENLASRDIVPDSGLLNQKMDKNVQIPGSPEDALELAEEIAGENHSNLVSKGIMKNPAHGNVVENVQQQGKQFVNKALSLAESAEKFFKSDPNKLDLSYYGLYDENGLPIYIDRNIFISSIQPVLICVCVAVGGTFLMILGYLQILLCTAMNFARLQERRYYEASDAGEEAEALQQ